MPKNFTRTLALTSAAALSAATISLAAAPSAQATQTSSSCVGTLVQDTPLIGQSSGKTLGYAELYWDASTGQNCAMTESSSATWGVPKYMGVWLTRCLTDTPSSTVVCAPEDSNTPKAYNDGTFSYYAGPVSVPGAGHCVAFMGEIAYANDEAVYDSPGSHC
ncbi:MAG TPA: hypothetical protein VGX23_21770 [Actinocrinis sp.]|nr:hypothetical protein [Actinocrinis sp.]